MSSNSIHKKYGLGSMGLGMATNLQKHISKTTSENMIYCNRSMNKGEPLKELGAKPEADFAKLVQQSDVIFTMVNPLNLILEDPSWKLM